MRSVDTVIKTAVVTDLVGSPALLEKLGDERASGVFARCDRIARTLLDGFGGQEIDKTDGFLLLFDRPIDACRYVIAYHEKLAELSAELGVALSARAGIHLGEVFLRENSPEDIARGAKPIEVEGLAKPTAARIAGLGQGRQTLLTRSAFELARRAAVGETISEKPTQWMAHGPYLFEGVDEPVEVFEVGVVGFAPLSIPPNSEKARRAVPAGEELTLGWRPAPGQEIPHRANWIVSEKLGEGGFGEVWLAAHKKTAEKRVFKFCFQAERLRSLRREVTLFRLMKEALGNRDDIARVLDWQFDEPPYFLESEYTEGGNFFEWAAQHGGLDAIPLATRLELISQVAVALSAAHSVGVLHKDIKPANVLITTDRDGAPRARLTDFGIGLVQNKELLLEKGITVYDFTGMMSPESESPAGTRMYMAPELIEGKIGTVQADIYALGVMLYQSVAGDFGRALAPNWERDIADEILREDIASLVDGNPQRRRASALEIAQPLRDLEGRRETRESERRNREKAKADRVALERAHRRRKISAAIAAAATVVLIVVSVLAVQATRAQRMATLRQGQAEDLINFMLGDLRAKLAPVGRLEILDDVGTRALAYFASLPPGQISADELFRRSKALGQIGEVRAAQGDLKAALDAFHESLTLAEEVVKRNPENGEWLIGLATAHFNVGNTFRLQSKLDETLKHFQIYKEIGQKLVAMDPANLNYQLELSFGHSNVAAAYEVLGDLPTALTDLEITLRIKQELAAARPENLDWQLTTASTHNRIGFVLERLGRLQEALEHYRRDIAIKEALIAKDPENTSVLQRMATAQSYAGSVLEAMGDIDAALRHFHAEERVSESLKLKDPANADWRRNFAFVQQRLSSALRVKGNLADSIDRAKSAVTVIEAVALNNPTSPTPQRDHAGCRWVLAEGYFSAGKLDQAESEQRRAAGILENMLGKNSRDTEAVRLLSSVYALAGRIFARRGKPAEARDAWSRAAELIKPLAEKSQDRRILDPFVRALLHLNQVEEAKPYLDRLRKLNYRNREFISVLREKGLIEKTS